MIPIFTAALQYVVHRYSGYSVAVGMIAHGVYQVCGDPAGDVSTGIKTVLQGVAALVALHHVTKEGAGAPAEKVADAPAK